MLRHEKIQYKSETNLDENETDMETAEEMIKYKKIRL